MSKTIWRCQTSLDRRRCKGNPFVVTAEAAIQDAKNPKRAQLRRSKPIWPWTRAAGSTPVPRTAMSIWVSAARTGRRHRCLFRSAGYQLHTNQRLDRSQQMGGAWPPAVTGHGPLGIMRADRISFRPRKKPVAADRPCPYHDLRDQEMKQVGLIFSSASRLPPQRLPRRAGAAAGALLGKPTPTSRSISRQTRCWPISTPKPSPIPAMLLSPRARSICAPIR